MLVWPGLTWDQALFYFLFFLFASLLLWLEREKNYAWYIYLTSCQPPPNLHNLTSAWPVTLLANKHLPYRNQILARIMSLLKSILGKRKFLSTSMFRWCFLKKILMCCFCDEILLAEAAIPLIYLTATNNKEFTDLYWLKLVDFVLCWKQWKKIWLKHHISRTERCCEREDRWE